MFDMLAVYQFVSELHQRDFPRLSLMYRLPCPNKSLGLLEESLYIKKEFFRLERAHSVTFNEQASLPLPIPTHILVIQYIRLSLSLVSCSILI